MAIVEGLFPATTPPGWSNLPLCGDPGSPMLPFGMEELKTAKMRLSSGKFSIPDANQVLLVVVRWNPYSLLRTLNAFLRVGTFPRACKTAKVLLLHKGPAKPIEEPSSYEPFLLLNGAGKLMEWLLLNRGSHQVTSNLALNQFGFRPGMV